MKQPEKWKETVDPFLIKFNRFKLEKVLGYPHARNDVFYCLGKLGGKRINCFVKYASRPDSNIKHEVSIIKQLKYTFLPEIIDYDENGSFVVTKEVEGERLSYILDSDINQKSIDYMFEYGKVLALIHSTKQGFSDVRHRKFFDVPVVEYLKENDIHFIYNYLKKNQPQTVNKCFCHGDFHYANILWKDRKIVGVLDWELSGIGNKEFDIAWAIINRPGQKFLRTKKEIKQFLKGYLSVNVCNVEFVKYYMILIYSHFISFDKDNFKYHKYVKNFLQREIKYSNQTRN